MYCTYCGSPAHPTSHCPKTWGGQANRMSLRCNYCGSKAHNYEACPKLGRRAVKGSVLLKD